MFRKIITLIMTALMICGLFVMPAHANAVETEVVFHDNMENVDGAPADSTRIEGYNMQMLGELTADKVLFEGYKYRRGFDNTKSGENYITYNVEGLDVDKMEIRFINSNSRPMADGKIKVAYSDDNVTYTDFAAVEPTYETETISGNNRYLFTYTFNIIPDCNYIKIYDTESMTFGSCTLVDFVLSRNVIEGTPVDNGIKFVELHDDMENVKNSSNVWKPADSTRIHNYSVTCHAARTEAQTDCHGYWNRRQFPNNSTAEYITYNVEGLDINTLTAVFTNGSKLNINGAQNIYIAYSNDDVQYTVFETVEVTYSATTDDSQYLHTFVVRDIPECKYIKIYENAANTFGSLMLVDFKLSMIYGETYSYDAPAEFVADSRAQSASNFTFVNKELAGYNNRLRFARMLNNGAATGNTASEIVWKIDGIDFNQVRLMFLGASSPKAQNIEVAYSANGTTWTKYTDSTDATTMTRPNLWSNTTTNASVQLYTWIINDITADWKYLKVSGPLVNSSSFDFAGLELRNNETEYKVVQTCVSDLTDSAYVAESSVAGTVTIENYTGYQGSTLNILALYKGDQLVDVDVSNLFTFSADYQETTDNTLDLTLPEDYVNDGSYTLKVFVWNSADAIKPLVAAE